MFGAVRVGGFTAALQRFGIGRLAAVLGVAAGVAAVLIALMLRVGQQPDALLYSNLDLKEAAEITAALDQPGMKYEVKGDGSTIMVPPRRGGLHPPDAGFGQGPADLRLGRLRDLRQASRRSARPTSSSRT